MSELLPITRVPEIREPLRIGDLAKRVGKSTRAVRLYEGLGLLGPKHRTEGGHRLYGDDALVRLGWIDKLQVLGMSLQEIKGFLDELQDRGTGPEAMTRVRKMFEAKLADVQRQIEAFQTLGRELQDGLEYLETCHACSPTTDFHACQACDHDHAIEEPPLITGIHRRGERK